MGIKILMLEDSEGDAAFIEAALKKGNIEYTGIRVDTQSAFIASLINFQPDVILSDHSLPQFDSLAALKIAKEMKPEVPFILVTGTVSEEFAVACIKMGADDYILKSNLTRLPSAVTGSLKKKELESENAIIKRLSQEKDRFTGLASHDIKNQIASMALTLELFELAAAGLTDKQKIYLQRLSRSTNNIQRLINDFLTVNHLESGVAKPVYTDVGISNLMRQIIFEYEEIAAQKNIKIEYVDSTDNSVYRTEENYLGIVFGNLISNAIKYNAPGKMVYVSLSKEGSSFRIKVKDEGQGISPDEMPKMYGRFQKLGSVPTGGEPSTGLGLSIVKDLIGVLNGSIECQSELGKGTQFDILLK